MRYAARVTSPLNPHTARRPQRFACRAGAVLVLTQALAMAPAVGAGNADPAPTAETRTVSVPLRLDTPLLQRLLETQLFTGPAGTHDLFDPGESCSQLTLSEPSLTPGGAELGLIAALEARLGVGAGGACTTLLRWQGRLDLAGTPVILEAGTAIGFEPARARLLASNGEPLPAGHRLQQLAEAGAGAFFADYRIDLRPQLAAMSALLPDVLPRQSRAQIDALLDSLRLTALRVDDDGIGADVRFAVAPAGAPAPPATALSDAELERWQARWQQMDALLVLAVKH